MTTFEIALNALFQADKPSGSDLFAEFGRAYDEIVRWPGYSQTPLHEIPALAQRCGVRRVFYKDEGRRFGGSNFKMLGGAYAVTRALRNSKNRPTFVTATGGNHGASVAWSARRFGCDCVLYIARGVSNERELDLQRLGARVIRVSGGYDDAVAAAGRSAATHGWILVADTSSRADDPVVIDVMAGYGVLVREVVSQLNEAATRATHIFAPCGVGGLTAAVVAYVRNAVPEHVRVIACEPTGAAPILRSVRAGTMTALSNVRSDFSCLACGVPSAPAWNVLARGLDAAVAIPDEQIAAAACDIRSRYGIAAGESAGAPAAAFTISACEDSARSALGLDANSVVVILGTEGPPGG